MLRKTAAITVLLIVAVVFPLTVNAENSYTVSFLFQAFLYIALSQSWNLIAGYTGQISLGQHAFFGAGAYAAGILWLSGWAGYLDVRAFIGAAVCGGVLAYLVGLPLLSKLRGDYFALGTLGLGEILRTVVTQGGRLTGGSQGLLLDSGVYKSIYPFYYLGLALAVGSSLVCLAVMRSRLGLAFVAVRDDECAASACGVRVLRYKLYALTISGVLAALAGSLYAYNIFQVMPDDCLGLQWGLYPILMCVAGGVGTLTGPIVGSILLAGVFQLSSFYLPTIHPLLSGSLIVILAICMPRGVMGLFDTGSKGLAMPNNLKSLLSRRSS